MALLHEAIEEKKMDVRMVERNLLRGALTHDEAAAMSKKLTDDSENAEWVSIDELKGTDAGKKPTHAAH